MLIADDQFVQESSFLALKTGGYGEAFLANLFICRGSGPGTKNDDMDLLFISFN